MTTNYNLRDRFSEFLRSKTVRNGLYILLSLFLVSPINFLFWILAARSFSEEIIGITISLLNLLMWIALLARLGVEDGLKRFLPEVTSEKNTSSTLINTSVFTSFTVSFPILSLCMIILYFFVPDYPSWIWSFSVILLIILYVTGTNMNTLFDSIAIGSGKSKIIIWRVLVNGIMKLAFLPLFFGLFQTGIFSAINIALWVPILIIWVFILPKLVTNFSFKTKPKTIPYPGFFKYSLKHYLYNILINSPTALLGLMVLILSSDVDAAYFSIGWMFISVFFAVSLSIGTSFMIETIRQRKDLKKNLLFTLVSIYGLLTIGFLIFTFFGKPILSLFGEGYTQAYSYILVAIASSFPYAINSIYFNYCKINNRMNTLILLNFIYIIVLFTGSILCFSSFGLMAISIFLVISNVLISISILIIELKRINSFIRNKVRKEE